MWKECISLIAQCNLSAYSCIWSLSFLTVSIIQLMKEIIGTTDCVSNFHCVRSLVLKVIALTLVTNSYSLKITRMVLWCTFLCRNEPLFKGPVGISSCSSSEWALAVVVTPQNGWTAMMYVCQEGHEHVVEALLMGGATVDIQDEVIPVITWQ